MAQRKGLHDYPDTVTAEDTQPVITIERRETVGQVFPGDGPPLLTAAMMIVTDALTSSLNDGKDGDRIEFTLPAFPDSGGVKGRRSGHRIVITAEPTIEA